MKNFKKTYFVLILVILHLIILSCSHHGQKYCDECPQAKISKSSIPNNIILFIGDGMGLSQVQSAVYTKFGQKLDESGEPIKLSYEKFPVFGYVTTFSSNSLVTDSAAAGTAIACGYKTDNGMLGVTPDGKSIKSVADVAKEKGKIVGVMSSVGLNHATPASFYAHVSSRGSYDDVTEQFLAEGKLDLLIGGGIYRKNLTLEAINEKAGKANFKVFTCENINDMTPEKTKDSRVFGYFDLNDNKQLDYESERTPENKEPHLSDLTVQALKILIDKKKDKGFFLMVESGSIDWACHDNKFEQAMSEVIELDKTVSDTIKLLEEKKILNDTLIIVTADHETGGQALNGPYKKVLNENENPEIAWTSKNHTAISVMIWATGPGAKMFSGKIDNTQIAKSIFKLLE